MNEKEKSDQGKVDAQKIITDANESGTGEVAVDAGDGGQAELDPNATMMAIDVTNPELDHLAETKVGIQLFADEEEDEKKQKPRGSLFSIKLFKKNKSQQTGDGGSFLLRPFMGLWICGYKTDIKTQIVFYGLRLALVAVSVYLHMALFEIFGAIKAAGHPSMSFYQAGIAVDLVLILLGLLLRFSPGWVVSVPLSTIAVIFAYGIYFYHTADLHYFAFNGQSISRLLNYFYVFVLSYAALVSVFLVAKKTITRIFFVFYYLVCLSAVCLNFWLKVDLELAFFGVGPLSDLPHFYYQPVFVLFHICFPLLMLLLLVFSLGQSQDQTQKDSRGYARSLLLLILMAGLTGFTLMQKNRVFHALNFAVPMELDVGAVEVDVLNQRLRIETRNFKKYGDFDNKSRYKLTLKRSQKANEFLLQVVDEFDFPVKNLSQKDFTLYSDGKKIDKYDLKEDLAINYKRGNYILTVELELKNPLLTWDKKVRTYTTSDRLEFNISDLSKVKRVVVREGDETLLDETQPKAEKLSLPIDYLESGENHLKISVFDFLDQEVLSETFNITVQEDAGFSLISPLKDDVVSGVLSVVILPRSLALSSIKKVTLLINEQVFYESETVNFHQGINLGALEEGKHELSVVLETEKGQMTQSAVFYKKEQGPGFKIISPTMGVFTLRQTAVLFALEGAGAKKIAGVSAFVNGQAFEDAVIKEDGFDLPVSRWRRSEFFLAVQATLDDGSKVSDWVQVNKGIGLLDLVFKAETLGFLNYKSVFVILDASVSQLDNWQGKEKWSQIKKVTGDSVIDKRIKKLNPGFLVFGSNKAHYYKDCEDDEVLIEPGSYNQPIFKRKLKEIKPTGVSALYSALQKSYSFGPEKIFIFTDSTDACEPVMSDATRSLIEKNSQAQIVVFALGNISKKDKAALKELALMTAGHFYQPDNYEILHNSWFRELELSYELYFGQELITREPLGARKFRLAPGKYTLKIPYGSEIKEVEFAIENTSKTSLVVEGKDKTIHVGISKTRL
ncbi:MAG: hypothetical protein HQM16_04285 [Deltaproteobacteria bacterium]|nr:hypothetical protein [Deltaproteobacteria bacterium]